MDSGRLPEIGMWVTVGWRTPTQYVRATSRLCRRRYSASQQLRFTSKLEIRSVERGICPIATSTIHERTVPIIMAGCMAHEGEGYISTSGLKSDVTIVFLDPDFL